MSMLFGPDALGYRFADSEAVAAIVDADVLANVREARTESLRHLVVVGDADSRDPLDPRPARSTSRICSRTRARGFVRCRRSPANRRT